jgi:hypothetical protein
VNVVKTLVDGKQVDYYLDRESHLPLKVAFPAADDRGTYYVAFSDYKAVDGIQMPQRVSYLGSDWLSTSYQLNVTYNEQIFERPPTIEAGPQAWKSQQP